MDPHNIPFNALIVVPTNSGKTQLLVNQLCGPFCGRFDYVLLICPTFAYNKTLFRSAERDLWLFVIICEQHKVEFWLKLVSSLLDGADSLIIIMCCLERRERADGEARQARLFRFPRRHQRVDVTKKLSERTWRRWCCLTRRRFKTTKTIFEEYAGELLRDDLRQMIARLKERKFSNLVFSLRHSFAIELKEN